VYSPSQELIYPLLSQSELREQSLGLKGKECPPPVLFLQQQAEKRIASKVHYIVFI